MHGDAWQRQHLSGITPVDPRDPEIHSGPPILNLLWASNCQGAFGLGGQDWVGPHRLVGRLVLGHTARRGLVGGSRQVIMRTALEVRQPVIGSGSHPDFM
jgi:hypothetical protein